MIPTDTTKKLDFTIKGLKEWSPAVGLHSLGFVCRMDPWELISPEEQDDVPASTEEIVAWRSKWVDEPKYSDPKAKGYKGVMADLVAYLISFTDAFDKLKTPQGDNIVEKGFVGVTMKQPIDGSNQMVLEKDLESPILALVLEILVPPAVQDPLLLEDTRGLVEDANDTSMA